ncbi:MAG: hypothetical protein COZ96_11250, partial [Nitrospirae bacterium CG_4_8_14_3_um_filter_70_85]
CCASGHTDLARLYVNTSQSLHPVQVISGHLLSHAGLDLRPWAHAVLDTIDFDKALLDGMLSFLLFAGALHLDLGQLRDEAWTVALLATVGVVTATATVGVVLWLGLSWVGVELSLPYCLVFGALISPTDPIAVLGILRQAKVPKSLE